MDDNLNRALAEYSDSDRAEKPVRRDVDEAAVLARSLTEKLDEVCRGYPQPGAIRLVIEQMEVMAPRYTV